MSGKFEQRDNSGVVFVNDKKEKDSHPDRTGTAMINGIEYWVSGWIKQGSKGQFLSLAFKPKEENAATKKPDGKTKNGTTSTHISSPSSFDNDPDSDIPW